MEVLEVRTEAGQERAGYLTPANSYGAQEVGALNVRCGYLRQRRVFWAIGAIITSYRLIATGRHGS